MTGDLPAALLGRIRRLARERGEDPQLLLVRYVNERFLYRLSVAPGGEAFVLKGGTLFLVWSGRMHRVTRDLDLLGHGAPEVARLEEFVRQVCTVRCDEDGVRFDPATVRGEAIREGADYGGIRIRLRGRLGRADVPVQVDVGFGDVVTPPPVVVEVPSVLDLPAARLRAYPWQAMLAEKVHTIVVLGRDNSRMKDFHDAWWLLSRHPPDGSLERAVRATFTRRGSDIPAMLPDALTDAFAEDPVKVGQWRAFLGRARVDERPELIAAIREVRHALSRILGWEDDGARSPGSPTEGSER